ncbi:MAG: efflux RND transporter periplasmic adaptor subunit [Gammaproteobacteria bacterium]|nr:efflux RND transporter periplasmic adaptor subunit [Gammaproteobacteria bacterium]
MHLPEKIHTRHYVILGIVIFVLIMLLIVTRPAGKATLQQISAPLVVTTTVQRMDLYPRVTVSGRLRPSHHSSLHFELSGQLVQRLVEPGQQVEQGQVLLQLMDEDYVDAVASARALYQQEKKGIARDRRLLKLAEENSALQLKEVERMERLRSESLTSRSGLDAAQQRLVQLQSDATRLRYAVDTAEARLNLRQAELNRVERQLDRAQLVAPFAGTVNAIAVQPGDYISPAQNVLELLDITQLDLYVDVPGHVIAALSLGQTVKVSVDDVIHNGEMVAIQRDPDPDTFTHTLQMRINGEGLLSGALASARLSLEKQLQVNVVPVEAVLREEGAAFVFLLQGNKVSRIPVVLGIREGSLQVIKEGLNTEDVIIARDVASLSEGEQVQIREQRQDKTKVKTQQPAEPSHEG